MAYDIFISYRRKGAGAGVAGELQAKLENRGYKVFLDVDNIGSGDFPEQIDQAIKSCNDFLLILSPGMLDRCVEEEDWVRHEIVLAEQYGKNIVGVSLPGFLMPEASELPEPLRNLPEKQVFLWSHEYRNASIDKIEVNLISSRRKKKRNRRNLTWILGLVVVAVVGIVLLMDKKKEEEVPADPQVEEDRTEMLRVKAINDTYSLYIHKGDSLLQTVSEPTEKEEFVTFMDGVKEYETALRLQRENPEIILLDRSLERKYDSLMKLRSSWVKKELDVATKFLNVDQFDFARYRFENAEALAIESDQQALEKVRKRFPKNKK
jgi:hypothetical protein